jgi:hypothetical protein
MSTVASRCASSLAVGRPRAALAKILLGWLLLCAPLSSAEPDMLRELLALNDRIIDEALVEPARGASGARATGTRLMLLACGYSRPESRYHREARVAEVMRGLAQTLRSLQHPSGLFDAGNLESPPDSAFILETLCQSQSALAHAPDDTIADLQESLRTLIVNTAEGVRTGGVHTPNHRWHVCAALAHVHRLYPDDRYLARIDEWLAEGIDQDEDGQYSERSPAYTSRVVNPALLHLALRLDRPEFLDAVRRNLEMTLAYVEPNGDVETVASRRQDQLPAARIQIWEYYAPYRYLAILDGNPRFATVARWIEREFRSSLLVRPHDPNMPLPLFLEIPELSRPLPADAALDPNTHHTAIFPATGLARLRRGAVTATLYGGSDAPSGFGVGSGVAMNPTFFKLRKGGAILDSVRLTPGFFGTGFFYSHGLEVVGDKYRLHETRRVPYYQPLRAADRNATGDYPLSADGRFFAKMAFDRRPKEFRTLEMAVTITEHEGEFALEFEIDGQSGVPVTIELAFRGDGTLSDVETVERPERAFGPASGATPRHALRGGFGRYTVGDDTIEFGPGSHAGPPGPMENEAVLWVGGQMRAEGQRVYLTGTTPFRHTLTIR